MCGYMLKKRILPFRVDWMQRHTLPVPVARGHYIPVKRGRYRDLFLCVIPFVSPLVPTNKELSRTSLVEYSS